ncbi:MAG TPA: ComF family protein [Clostridia bacterium]|nr:ComF family protein [Clostridia bacterium]
MPKIAQLLSQLVFPDDCTCKACGKEALVNEYYLCEACMKDLVFIGEACPKCGKPKLKAKKCDDCKQTVHIFNKCVSVCEYDGTAEVLIKKLKYANQRHIALTIAKLMSAKLAGLNWKPDMIIPVPMHKKAQRRRGFNQAELLARTIADMCNVDMMRALVKTKETPPQAGLDRKGRLKNLRGSFSMDASYDVTGKSVVIIDDVFTTGATADACAEVLYAAGAKNVNVFTFLTGRYS